MEKKKPHRHLLRPRVLLAAAVTILLTLSPAASQTDSGDSAVMLTLFKTLGSNKNLGWSNSGDPCSSWNHVRCDGNRVIAIQIGNLNLTGTLPPSLANLTKLQRLEVMENQISGPLPTLKGLGDLQFLLIHNNFFSSIPPDFFDGLTGLVAASLDHNPFPPWMIPDGLTSSSQLQNFSAVSANVTGKMPDFFAGFTSLENLALAFNSLEGGLPASLGSLATIRSLWLNSQFNGGLSGSIDVVQNMTSLEQLWLHSNSFSGPLPDFSGLTSLKDLQLRDNDFTGPVPSSLRSLKSLKVVKLANNKFQGDFPLFDKSVAVDIDNESFCLPTPGECDVYVNIMLSIAKSFDYPDVFASNWKGNDPCSSWLGVGCDSSGNITVINFNSKGLNGMISRDFSLIPSLETLVLSKNNIKGTIPEVLTNLKNLKRLDLSNNNLYGNVPAFSQNVVVNTSGNPDIGKDHSSASPPGSSPPGGGESNSTGPGNSTDSSNGSSSVSVGVIVGSVIGGVCIVFVIGFLIFCFYKRKQHTFSRVQSPSTTVIHPRHSGSDPDLVKITTVAGSSLAGGTGSVSEAYSQTSSGPSDLHVVEGGNMVISIQVLRNVTNNFSSENILGRGGFGTVYKGELHDGTKIAVKRMESGVMGSKGLTEFKSEIAVLTKVRHRHLVSLLGYCLDGNERLLVYEYMPQGTLSRHLFNWKDEGLMPLEWKKRLSIVLDVARGVEYLHTLAHQSFIHRDLKPSNILLGDDMKAKVADFGLVRLAPDGKCSVETRLAGTFGYLAPEYAVTGRVTTKADVFSFGVILMELITGRKALDESQPEESVHLVTWFRRMQINKDTFRKAIDPAMDLDEETLASVSTVSELAGHCCAREPYQRPDMGHAVNVLSSLSEMWKPTDPDLEESYGIDLDLTLPQALKKWQAFEGNSQSDIATSSCPPSLDNTQTSIPTRPTGFADSFTSADGR